MFKTACIVFKWKLYVTLLEVICILFSHYKRDKNEKVGAKINKRDQGKWEGLTQFDISYLNVNYCSDLFSIKDFYLVMCTKHTFSFNFKGGQVISQISISTNLKYLRKKVFC